MTRSQAKALRSNEVLKIHLLVIAVWPSLRVMISHNLVKGSCPSVTEWDPSSVHPLDEIICAHASRLDACGLLFKSLPVMT
jgi:hypothetical protein